MRTLMSAVDCGFFRFFWVQKDNFLQALGNSIFVVAEGILLTVLSALNALLVTAVTFSKCIFLSNNM